MEEKNEPEKDARPVFQTPNLSCSDDESVTTYIQMTISNFPRPQLEHPVQEPKKRLFELVKVSESEPVMATVGQPAIPANQIAKETQSGAPDNRELYSDTSDEEKRFDNSGVDLPALKPVFFTLDPDISPGFDDELHHSSGNSDTEQALYRTKISSSERKLTSRGRMGGCQMEVFHKKRPNFKTCGSPDHWLWREPDAHSLKDHR